jgi:signal transduction histidine kinase
MFQITPYAISGLIIAAAYLPLFIFISSKGNSKLSTVYSLHIFAVFIWGVGCFFAAGTKDPQICSLFWKFGYSGVLFIPVFFQHAVMIITKSYNRIYLIFCYVQAIYFLLSMFVFNSMMASTKLMFDSFYYHVSTLTFLISFILWTIIVSMSHLQLILYYKICYPGQKSQIRSLILAITGFWGGISNFLPALGLMIYPWGNFLVPIHSIIIFYAIFKDQLLDIKVAIRQSVVYSALATCITIIYLGTVLILEKLLQSTFKYESHINSAIIAFIIGMLLMPLRNKIQKIVDKTIFPLSPEEMMVQNEKLRQQVATSEKYKMLGTLSGGIAHEIKNPLTAIKTFSEKLPEKSNDPQFVEKFSRIVNQEVDRIDDLVNQLLDYSRPNPPHQQPTDIHKLIDSTLDVLSSNLLKAKINLEKNYVNKKCLLPLDQNQIRQSLMNIFLNAIDAMPLGGMLGISTTSTENTFIISIKDTGPGISPQDIPRIFEPFFTKKDNGTGLGLAITQTIIKNHGGKIYVRSKTGQGSEFIIELPIQVN